MVHGNLEEIGYGNICYIILHYLTKEPLSKETYAIKNIGGWCKDERQQNPWSKQSLKPYSWRETYLMRTTEGMDQYM